MLALWCLVVFSFLGLETAVFARTDAATTRHMEEALRGRYVARGGVLRGIGVLTEYQRLYPASPALAKTLNSGASGPRTYQPPLRAFLDSARLADVPLGGGRFTVHFEDLAARLNVNRVDSAMLANLIVETGVDRGHAEELADAILDWIDPDDLHRARGAERDFYERRGLAKPRNSAVTDLVELLRVRGMTREIFYGGARQKGLAQFLTTEGVGVVNVNTAPPEVLLSVPGLDPAMVRQIVAARELRNLTSLDDALGMEATASVAASRLLGFLTFQTREVRVEAVAELPGSSLRSRVTAQIGILPGTVIVRSWEDDPSGRMPLAPRPMPPPEAR